ncbi:hypothetical protein B0H17DRAFT_1197445 [Mycena rosella]|uniref:Uncharacterized protein n=1 Tax=Mycena rosella TaxID=1033263 RepID=A0AAD7DSN4_MYCRO|nr:hypothetical protein B0H17DRAFT_1197445 [Mycena rosella]
MLASRAHGRAYHPAVASTHRAPQARSLRTRPAPTPHSCGRHHPRISGTPPGPPPHRKPLCLHPARPPLQLSLRHAGLLPHLAPHQPHIAPYSALQGSRSRSQARTPHRRRTPPRPAPLRSRPAYPTLHPPRIVATSPVKPPQPRPRSTPAPADAALRTPLPPRRTSAALFCPQARPLPAPRTNSRTPPRASITRSAPLRPRSGPTGSTSGEGLRTTDEGRYTLKAPNSSYSHSQLFVRSSAASESASAFDLDSDVRATCASSLAYIRETIHIVQLPPSPPFHREEAVLQRHTAARSALYPTRRRATRHPSRTRGRGAARR